MFSITQGFLPDHSPSIPALSTRPSFPSSCWSAASQADILSEVLCTGMCKQSQENTAGGILTLPSREPTEPTTEEYLKLSSPSSHQNPISPETRGYHLGKWLRLKQGNTHKDAVSESRSRHWEGYGDEHLGLIQQISWNGGQTNNNDSP